MKSVLLMFSLLNVLNLPNVLIRKATPEIGSLYCEI